MGHIVIVTEINLCSQIYLIIRKFQSEKLDILTNMSKSLSFLDQAEIQHSEQQIVGGFFPCFYCKLPIEFHGWYIEVSSSEEDSKTKGQVWKVGHSEPRQRISTRKK